MQSDGNSFCGDVVLDSFNMAYRDDENNNYKKNNFFELYYEDLKFEKLL